MKSAVPFGRITILFVVVFALSISAVSAQQQTAGLFIYDQSATSPGYTLFAPAQSTTTYLIDMYGRYVNSWHSGYMPGMSVYLLESGDLLRAEALSGGTGGGGRIERIDWDGNITWEFEYSSEDYLQHHDIEPLPNGNVLLIAWEFKTEAEAIAAGRDSLLLTQGQLDPTQIVEVKPVGVDSGEIVWEWHAWDHLIQDIDSTKANYGVVADHPELVNINFMATTDADWIHANAVDYNPQLDQIVISSRALSEIWVIDHSTTTEEAASHSGGNSGMGGDILYRWGNPQAYNAGFANDQKLFQPHDARWIPAGYPGAGNLMVFNNGDERPTGQYSTIEEITPPVDGSGNYTMPSSGNPYDPSDAAWRYEADPPTSFFSANRSGAQRLANGNTLICEARHGDLFEVTPEGETVWRYVNPVKASGPVAQGASTNGNGMFRCTRYAADFPGLTIHDLTPLSTIEIYPITISGAAHMPVVPLSSDSVVITAQIASDNPITSTELFFDGGAGLASVAMYDDGNHHDGLANDSLYGAVLSPNLSATMVKYYIIATDDASNSVSDPNIAPATTYLYMITPAAYICGDADGSGDVDIDDVVFLISYIFSGGPGPDPMASGDADCAGGIDIDDVVYLISYIFGGGSAPCDADNDGMPDC